MPKFNAHERSLIETIVATLSLKRLSDVEIIQEIFDRTNKTVTKQTLCNIRNRIKKESSKWYSELRENQYSYIHEFRKRVNEIEDLMKRHYEIVDSDKEPTAVKQSSLVELHKLSISLSNLIEVAPSIGNAVTLPATPEVKPASERTKFIV